ncbi:HpcH/HpaI aldolase/citrate lyase family protein [Massilia sp. Dwa41.01b]|uniref:HpcH/HpaI aldolase/citrate lyase family protein n=1 Tax=unclassified Massilia TaxID=2609279 RepID=UPI0015FFCDC6|nr:MULTISPECIES: HpcH/HpaI aldolase/citrate lyase family protein [unclassified Massilia]QNA87589.1 HpcH/HpaI aldolase/citrate lyase family protein [Massilia sp. Dwa41.01b]QNA98492.1 HpcH/HpaI aldolase/citrate lyase family protein [Massilia sp. Se16.2.3]
MHESMGASLYVPANHKDLLQVANGEKLPQARSLIFCTEDAVADRDLSWALFNLSVVLQNMHPDVHAQRFVRVRNPEVLARVLAMPGVHKLAGFVIPKATRQNFESYYRQVRDTRHLLMPTLETAEVFSEREMEAFRELLQAPGVRNRILALRIGGNDLLALLGLRRPRGMTIYRTPLGPVIARLVTIFRPWGFMLTAPVFEHLDAPALLDQEVLEDIAYGMVGKTAIHPSQIAPIEQHYKVKPQDLAAAHAILDENSPAVFKLHESMCEVATHRAWAERLVAQSRRFGAEASSIEREST